MSSAKARGRARGQQPPASNPAAGRGANPARGRVAPFDGPASRGSASGAGAQSQASGPAGGSRRGSNAGSTAPSQAPSQTAAPAAARGLDPASDGPPPRTSNAIRNVDMPASFYNIDGLYTLPTTFVKRPGFSTVGKAIQLPINSYEVTSVPKIKVFQYDVIIGNGAEKRIVQQKVWASNVRKTQVGNDLIYDGNKLAWSNRDVGQKKIMVDLNFEESGRADTTGKNTFRLHIQQSKILNLACLPALLQGKVQHSTEVLEAINFLDHLMRETPTNNERLTAVKRSFFARNGARQDLGGGVEVFRGVYQSIRPAQGGKMVVNLDVSNTTFWKPQSLLDAIREKNSARDISAVAQQLANPNSFNVIHKYLKKLSVRSHFNGNPQPTTVYKIEKLSNLTANTHRISWRDPQTNQDTGEMIALTAYFSRKYNVTLRYAGLPLVQMTKKVRGNPVMYPPELLVLVENQRYAAKLDEIQTANMIKFAVSPPAQRLAAINEGKSWLEWESDPLFRSYGLAIKQSQIVTAARILPPPGVKFGKNTDFPGMKGRWDLRGKQFVVPNPAELKSWGIGLFTNGRVKLDKAQIEKFAMDFTRQYRGHGGTVANTKPFIVPLNNDPGEAVNQLFQSTGEHFNSPPQLLIFLVQSRDSQHYLRIKKSCDIRFGIVSQVMQASQVAKGNPQYISNVLMKVNAKLGGATAQAVPGKGSGWSGSFSAPTVFIGADVSHASPGSEQASMAAITVSFDRIAARYAAACQTNGRRVEMISEQTMKQTLGPLLTTWMSNVGGGKVPQQVYYIRDGVSEGQFIQVMNEEIPSIRFVLDKLSGGKWAGKLTVIIAGKRHHIRAFPKQGDGDQKGNPVPGTVIEKDVTSPQEFDFYLYSHVALQGTSRPVHYTVLHDEANHKPDAIQSMIYEHCYQYMRSTTAVSMHPAVYYAHLASNRAKAHENIPAAAGPQGGAGFKQNQPPSSDTPKSSEVAKLMPLNTKYGIQYSMWYI